MATKTTQQVAWLTGAAKDDLLALTDTGGGGLSNNLTVTNLLFNDPGSATLYGVYKTATPYKDANTKTPLDPSMTTGTALGGTITVNQKTGAISYTPPATINGVAYKDYIHALGAGASVADSFYYVIWMGNQGAYSLAKATVNLTGIDDAATIKGTFSGSVIEDAITPTDQTHTSGALTVLDPDNNESGFNAQSYDGKYGTLVVTPGTTGTATTAGTGNWSYQLNHDLANSLQAGETQTESFTIKSIGGTTQTITVTVTGTNDAATIAGDLTNKSGEDDATITGNLTVIDPDHDQSAFAAQTVAGTYGTLTLNPGTTGTTSTPGTGSYTYTLNHDATNPLRAGETVKDTIHVQSIDGSDQTITVTITGSDDAATIGGQLTNGAGEDDVSTGGTLTVLDPDHDESGFTAQTVSGTYGTLTLTPGTTGTTTVAGTGSYTYTLNHDATNPLQAGEKATDYVKVKSIGGTEETITITITGANDAATIGGDLTNGAGEDDVSTTGTLTALDPDHDQSGFTAQTVTGTYGTLTLAPGTTGTTAVAGTGSYTYTLNHDATNPLQAGETVTDYVNVTSLDGSEQTIAVTITGANDAAVIGGDVTGSVKEDTKTIATGTLTVADPDHDQSSFDAQTQNGTYGTFSLAAGTGTADWTYTLDHDAANSLSEGEQKTETFTVMSVDGTPQDITVTITGTNDAPVITSDAQSGAVWENPNETTAPGATDTAGGQVTYTDPDELDTHTFSTTKSDFGHVTVDADGNWTYTVLDKGAVDALPAGQQLSDSFVIRVTDNQGGYAEQTVNVSITGTNDPASITGKWNGEVHEDGQLTDSGTLKIRDVDTGEDHFASWSPNDLQGAFGKFTFDGATGDWTYTLDNSNPDVQALNSSDTMYDVLQAFSVDGTEKDVVITIHGADEPNTANTGGGGGGGTDGGGGTPDPNGAVVKTMVNNGLREVNSKLVNNFDGNDQLVYSGDFSFHSHIREDASNTYVYFTHDSGKLKGDELVVVLVGYHPDQAGLDHLLSSQVVHAGG